MKDTIVSAKDEFLSEKNVFTDESPLEEVPSKSKLFEGSAAYRAAVLRLSKVYKLVAFHNNILG